MTTSSESEYMVLSEMVNERRFLRQVKAFMVLLVDERIRIQKDNEGAEIMAKTRFSSRRTRHADVKNHIIRDAIEGGMIRVHMNNTPTSLRRH